MYASDESEPEAVSCSAIKVQVQGPSTVAHRCVGFVFRAKRAKTNLFCKNEVGSEKLKDCLVSRELPSSSSITQ